MSREIDPAAFTRSNHPAFHYEAMLADGPRMAAYRRAIEACVRRGDVVADLGTGVGVLAVMAAQAGAARVYAVDRRPRSVWMAERVAADNGVADRVRPIEGDAQEIELPEPVDVIVNELIGDFGTDEGIVASVGRFAARHLGPEGRICPQRLRTYLAPVEYAAEFRGVWRADHHGLDLRAGNAVPCKPEAAAQAIHAGPRRLAEPVCLEDVHFDREWQPRADTFPLRFEIGEEATLQGFIGWFEATLWEDVTLETSVAWPGCHWKNWHWPVSPALAVRPGQIVSGELHAPSSMQALAWRLDWQLA